VVRVGLTKPISIVNTEPAAGATAVSTPGIPLKESIGDVAMNPAGGNTCACQSAGTKSDFVAAPVESVVISSSAFVVNVKTCTSTLGKSVSPESLTPLLLASLYVVMLRVTKSAAWTGWNAKSNVNAAPLAGAWMYSKNAGDASVVPAGKKLLFIKVTSGDGAISVV